MWASCFAISSRRKALISLSNSAVLRRSKTRFARSGRAATIALIGVLSGAHAPLNLPLAVMRQVRLQGITCGSHADMARMMAAIETHRLEPWVHEIFPLDRYQDAFKLMREGGHVGKIVIALDNDIE